MTTSSSESSFNHAQNMILIFTGESYDFWSTQMKTLFISQDLRDLIEEGYEQPDDLSTLAAAKLKEYKQNKQKRCKGSTLHPARGKQNYFP